MQRESILRLILGDQLNEAHSWFETVRADVTYAMMETREEACYVRHHIQKIAAFFAAMRSFAETLRARGHRVRYLRLDDPENRQAIRDNVLWLVRTGGFTVFQYQEPDEHRVDAVLKRTGKELGIPFRAFGTEHFYTERGDVAELFAGSRRLRMEHFYRRMRRDRGILVQRGRPEGGRWNFDRENRSPLGSGQSVPEPLLFDNDVADIAALLRRERIPTIGSIREERLIWPVVREQALQLLRDFLDRLLPWFGTYQDAMHTSSWSLFHSRLSFALNVKLLSPGEVVDAAVQRLREQGQTDGLAQVEGFVRQILGWREFMRGVYWAFMPDYATWNHFGHQGRLPGFYWDGETRMRCLRECISQTLVRAYAHHIQRLMVTGNFALLAGVHPDEVDEWYLGVYIDAVQWVETTNTRGMSQFADGGIVASKPYAASANYISAMSDYCKHCEFDAKKREQDNACPFNSLYWDFFARSREALRQVPRIATVYATWDRMEPALKRAIRKRAGWVLAHLQEL
jgi:deoxyribodipyrimidine photolyase-related protein